MWLIQDRCHLFHLQIAHVATGAAFGGDAQHGSTLASGQRFAVSHDTARKLLKSVEEFHTYIERNQAFIPNYGERYHHGERLSMGFAESTVNQVVSKRLVKKQQMQWSPRGPHLLLQIRTRVLNGEWEATFRTWSPGFRTHTLPAAA
jgi:hypothetical protein